MDEFEEMMNMAMDSLHMADVSLPKRDLNKRYAIEAPPQVTVPGYEDVAQETAGMTDVQLQERMYKKAEAEGMYTPPITVAMLKNDPTMAAASRDVYELFEGKQFQGSDADAVQYGIDVMGEFTFNFAGPVGFELSGGQSSPGGTLMQAAALIGQGDANKARAFLYVMDQYDRLGVEAEGGFSRMFKGLVADPSNWAAAVTLGGSKILQMGGQTATKQGIKYQIRQLAKTATEKVAKYPAVAAGVGEAIRAGATEERIIGIEEEAGAEIVPEEKAARIGIASAVGGLTGAGFVKGAEAAGKGLKAGIEETVMPGIRNFVEGAEGRVLAREADTAVQLNAGVDVPAAIDKAIVAMQNRTPPIERDELVNVLRLRADQMRLAPKDRIQPSGEKMFDTSPEAYVANLPEQAETPVPRALPNTTLPKGNRAALLVEKQDTIAQQLAERMKPYLGTPAQYFYNTGPIIQKAIDLGVPEDVARQQLKRFALNYAATSPRTMTEQNLRNASLVTAKQERGVPIEDVIGPGGEGMNEKGYPMMIGPSGIHRKLVDAAAAEGIDFNTNPKPATFAENVAGNLSGVTVDTHAIRGVLDAMNEIEPGSIPEGFIKKEFRDQYKNDPSSLDPATMIDDTLGDQMVDGTKMQTEYAVFSDIYKKAAEILGVSPAEAQSLGWFGSGDRTGLASEMKTVVDLIDDRVDVTAKATGRSKEDVFIDFFSGKIPLLSIGGLTLLETGSRLSNDESETM